MKINSSLNLLKPGFLESLHKQAEKREIASDLLFFEGTALRRQIYLTTCCALYALNIAFSSKKNLATVSAKVFLGVNLYLTAKYMTELMKIGNIFKQILSPPIVILALT